MSRHAAQCPKCQASMLIGTADSIAPHLRQAGYSGLTVVHLHALPLCDDAQERADEALAEVDARIAEAKAKADAKAERMKRLAESSDEE